MSENPGPHFDIFLSYPYVQNKTTSTVKVGWVDHFVENLERYLAEAFGRDQGYRLFRDSTEIQGHAQITPRIRQAVQSSSTFLMVLSPGYLKSPWCMEELGVFLDTLKQGDNDLERIFVVRLRKPSGNDPPGIGGTRGYEFWTVDFDGTVRTLGDPQPNPEHDSTYYKRIEKLAQDLVAKITGSRAVLPRPPGDRHGTVFLAQVTEDLEPRRELVQSYLTQMGLTVLPERWYSDVPAEFQAAAVRDLAQSDLFVQLLCGTPGRRSVALPKGYNGLQHELAIKAGKPVLQWRPVDLDTSTVTLSDHKQLLEGGDVIPIGIEEFKKMIVDRFVPKGEAAGGISGVMVSGTNVFINAGQDDLGVGGIVRQVCDKQLVPCVFPMATKPSSPSKLRKQLETWISLCDPLVIVYGKSPADWVLAQWSLIIKGMQKRTKPPRAVALLRVPPPASKGDHGFHHPLLRLIDCRLEYDPADEGPILAEVEELLAPLLKEDHG